MYIEGQRSQLFHMRAFNVYSYRTTYTMHTINIYQNEPVLNGCVRVHV